MRGVVNDYIIITALS